MRRLSYNIVKQETRLFQPGCLNGFISGCKALIFSSLTIFVQTIHDLILTFVFFPGYVSLSAMPTRLYLEVPTNFPSEEMQLSFSDPACPQDSEYS